jgi:hypothetical protein
MCGTSRMSSAEPVSRMRSHKVGPDRFDLTMRAIRNTQHRGLQQKISTPATTLLCFTRVKHLRIARSDITEGFCSIENKIFPTSTNKNKPRYDLRDAKQRAREIRSIYPCRSHSGNVQMNVVGVVILASPPRGLIRSKRHNGWRLRALHKYSTTTTPPPPPRSSKV